MECEECGQEMKKTDYCEHIVYNYTEYRCECGHVKVVKKQNDKVDKMVLRKREKYRGEKFDGPSNIL